MEVGVGLESVGHRLIEGFVKSTCFQFANKVFYEHFNDVGRSIGELKMIKFQAYLVVFRALLVQALCHLGRKLFLEEFEVCRVGDELCVLAREEHLISECDKLRKWLFKLVHQLDRCAKGFF